jgi:2-polyprenyl-3-methyl-5-hydroxy-6-metoxy-1,4-benzoquinol methylase
MLTVDPDRLVSPGDRVLDVGCGEGRHTHAAAMTEGVEAVGLDLDRERVAAAREGFDSEVAEVAPSRPTFCTGDAVRLPFADGSFDVVVCSEVLEHLPDYREAIDELDRVLAPGGTLAVSVPRSGPERVCWALSADYHQVEGGHVRIFDPAELRRAIEGQGLAFSDREHAHAFHAPYWWLKCLWWDRDQAGNPPAPLAAYERFLEWAEFGSPPIVGRIEAALDRFLGKSVVMYFEKPETAGEPA